MNKEKICNICNKTFHYQSGGFFIHLNDVHNINREQYVILTEYNNIHPKCQCGFCEDDAVFLKRQNKFQPIKYEHRNHEWLKLKYIEKYGHPKCENINCEKGVIFKRGKPLKYCSIKCRPGNWNQEKIKQTLEKRYGVKTPMDVEKFKIKHKESNKISWNKNKENIIQKAKITKYVKYGNENYVNVNKIKDTIYKKYGVEHISKTKKFREESSDRMKKNNPMKDNKVVEKMVETYIKNINSGKTKLYKHFKFKQTTLNYQSKNELFFLEYCELNNLIQRLQNGKCFKFLKKDNKYGKRYISDFLIDNKLIIEIKSSYILKKQGGYKKLNAKIRSVRASGYDFVLILDNDLTDFIEKISKLS